MLRAMIIGCGKIAWEFDKFHNHLITHAASYTSEPLISLCCSYDSDQAKSHALGNRFECESVESIELGLNKFKPDVVSICTPDETHFNITSDLLRHDLCPKVIFLEKLKIIKNKMNL